MQRITRAAYNKEPKRYRLVSGNTLGAPPCPFGNPYTWLGYDQEQQAFVRFTKSVFKELIKKETHV